MKKIIGGKRYDTETADFMGSDSYSNTRDFHYWYEGLYRKRNGEFFLYGEGGAASKYAETVGQNEWCGGEKIIPLSVEKAKEWAEKHLSCDTYEKIFGAVEDDTGEKMTWTVSISPATVEKVRRIAGEQQKTLSEVVEYAVNALQC